jgi:hypothetical protein
MISFKLLFIKCLGSMVDPIKNPINAISSVMTRLFDGVLIDKSRNIANRNRTINGLKT